MQFTQKFENKVKATIQKYDLISKNDKVLVACSGGKDSTTALYLLKKFNYNVEALFIDLIIGNWSKRNLDNIRKFCEQQKIKLHIIDMRKEFGCSICYIRSTIQSKAKLTNCTICGVIKRWLINKKAREFKAAKLVTGHNLDDAAETVIMNLLTGNPKLGISAGPKTGMFVDKKFVQRIKPLYFCSNEEVKKYSETMDFPVLYAPCPCSEGVFRRQIRSHLEKLEKSNKNIKINLVNNSLAILPDLQKKCRHTTNQLRYCSICGEPSSNHICRRCSLIKVLGVHA